MLFKNFLKEQKNLEILEASVEDLIIKDNKLSGVVLERFGEINSKSIVLTAGTFLRGLIRLGKDSFPAGRIGDKPSINFSKNR